MNATIAHIPVQMCDINPKQPTDLFCKKSMVSMRFFTKEIYGLFGIDITDLNTNLGNDCIHHSSQWSV